MRTSNALGALDLPPRSRRIADMFSWKTVQDALFSVHRADHSARGVSAQELAIAQQDIAACCLAESAGECGRPLGGRLDSRNSACRPPCCYSTGSQILDADLGGGLPSGCITELIGAPGSGKTQACLCAAVHCALNGGRVLYIDAENAIQRSRLSETIKFMLSTSANAVTWSDSVLDNIRILNVFSIFSLLEQLSTISPTPDGQYQYDLLVLDGLHALIRPYSSDSGKKVSRVSTGSRRLEAVDAPQASVNINVEPLYSQVMVLLRHLISTLHASTRPPAVATILLTSLLEVERNVRSRPGFNGAQTIKRGRDDTIDTAQFVLEGRSSSLMETIDIAVLVANANSSVQHNGCHVIDIIKRPHWLSSMPTPATATHPLLLEHLYSF